MRRIIRFAALAGLLAGMLVGPAHGQNAVVNWKDLQTSPGSKAVTPATPLPVTVTSTIAGGATPYHLVAANTNNSTSLKATAGTVYAVQLGGIGAAPAYLKLYDKASAPTCASDAVVVQFIIPAASTAANGGGSNVSIPVGKNFTNGIAFCVVTGIADNDNTAVAAATFIINIDYK